MRTPTDVLRDEHRVILRALDVLEAAADRPPGGGVPDAWWESLLGWLRGFADRSHHAKEERALFPAMVKAGVPSEGGPIAVMLEEHQQGRFLIKVMAAGAAAGRSAAAREYAVLLRQHIDKENGILFPLADAVLAPEAQEALRREFEGVELEQGREATLAAAEAALDRLSGGPRHGPPHPPALGSAPAQPGRSSIR